MKEKKQPKGKFGNVYLIDYSPDGIHSYFTVGVGKNGPYNDDNFDCEVINGEPYQYKSGGGGDVESIVKQYAGYPSNCEDCWVDFDLLSKMEIEFSDQTKALFLAKPRLLVTADSKSGKNPLKIENETYSGFCHCSICGHMVDENDSMCSHLIYTPFGTDEYAGIGNDDLKFAWYALRYIGKERAMACVEYKYGWSFWEDCSPFDGEDIEDDDVITEWCGNLLDAFGFCPSSIDDAIAVWRGMQLLGSIDNEAREKMPDDMAKLKEMILNYPYETAATKRPIHKEDLPITIDGKEIAKSLYYGEDFIGVLPDGSKMELVGLFVDHVSMEIENSDEEE